MGTSLNQFNLETDPILRVLAVKNKNALYNLKVYSFPMIHDISLMILNGVGLSH